MTISLLTARWVIPVTSPMIEHGAVAIDGDRLLAVGPLADLEQRYGGVPVTDLGRAAILPGLINIHTHLELTIMRGRVEEPAFQSWITQLVMLKVGRLSADDLLESSRLGTLEAIRGGITTVADTADASATLEALLESGMRGIFYQECFGPGADQAEAGLDAMRAKLDARRETLSRTPADSAARVRLGISPHAPYTVSARLFEMATRHALDNSLDMAIHAAESEEERRFLLDGGGAFGDSLRRRGIGFTPPACSTVTYLEQLGVLACSPLLIHGVTIGEEELPLLARRGVRLAHCPRSNAKFGHGVAPLDAWQRAGLSVGLGTDSVVSNNSCDLIEDARFGALIHRARLRDGATPSANDMLRLMTIDGARAIGMESLIGSLEPGKKADIIAVGLDSPGMTPCYDPVDLIIFSSSASDVVMTMVDGQLLYDGQTVSTIDEEPLLVRCRSIAEKLSASLGI